MLGSPIFGNSHIGQFMGGPFWRSRGDEYTDRQLSVSLPDPKALPLKSGTIGA